MGIEHLLVTEVDPAGQTVEVTNTSPHPVSVGTPLPFSHRTNEADAIPAGAERPYPPAVFASRFPLQQNPRQFVRVVGGGP